MINSSKQSIAIFGYTGRMGQEVITELEQHTRFEVGALIGRHELEDEIKVTELLADCTAMIDFTNAGAQQRIYEVLENLPSPLPMVTGVTGLDAPLQMMVNRYARKAPVLQAANFSIGISLLKYLCSQSAAILGEEFDAEIFELHHRHKLDAPSGTAHLLAQAVMEGKQKNATTEVNTGSDLSTPRDSNYVHVSAGRGGGVFGDHTVFFLGPHERLELKHSALNRSVFAAGALKATEWCLKQSPGLYKMDHIWEF